MKKDKRKKGKIGRNDSCPCGSGKKYKKCHLGKDILSNSDDLGLMLQEREAKEFQRKEQQGLGKPIISTDADGTRFIAVGSEVHYSKNWRTFPDFLFDYIIIVLGSDWGNAELKKKATKRHLIIQWYEHLVKLRKENFPKNGKIGSFKNTGASKAYLDLAYNLYLLQHNVGVQSEIIRRLKQSDKGNFYGALYETFVAASFIKAGFDIEFENERDRKTTHCEFTATYRESGRKFSVEAKAIKPSKRQPQVESKLNQALKKKANHERVIFIGISKPVENQEYGFNDLKIRAHSIKKGENSPEAVNLPPAYIFITNQTFWHDLNGSNHALYQVIEGFKIPSFNHDFEATVRDFRIERERNRELLNLHSAIKKHYDIPSTFEGENPIFVNSSNNLEESRFVIGKKYLIPRDKGKEVVATLTHALVNEINKEAFCSYNFVGGGSSVGTHPLSDQELAAYQKHPETFFGKIQPKNKSETILDVFDWCYGNHKNMPKDKLLEAMKDASDIEDLKKENQEELAKVYSERMAEAIWLDAQK